MRIRLTILKRVALAICVAAVAAPSASAYFPDYGPKGSSTSTPATGAKPAPPTVKQIVVRPTGFDWGDAGIGAGTVSGLILLAGGSALLVRRGRRTALAFE